jgi:hypothetical protein
MTVGLRDWANEFHPVYFAVFGFVIGSLLIALVKRCL